MVWGCSPRLLPCTHWYGTRTPWASRALLEGGLMSEAGPVQHRLFRTALISGGHLLPGAEQDVFASG